MRLTRFIPASVIVAALLAATAAAAPPACGPHFRVGNIVGAGKAGCTLTYAVDTACGAHGKCPTQQNRAAATCTTTGSLTYSWTVTQTGGTGSIAVGTLTGATVAVTVTPPATYSLTCTVGGCAACCKQGTSVDCMTPAVVAPAQAAKPKTDSVASCG